MAVPALARRLALSALSLVLLVALAEVGLRTAGFRHAPFEPPLIRWDAPNDRELASAAGLHEAQARELWAPRPGAHVTAQSEETINAEGYRGPLRARAKPAGVRRVAVFGDSSTFGMNVEYEQTYAAQLEALLAPGVEVLDFGVIGTTARQGLERYERLARAYAPDVVVAAYGAINEHFAAKLGRDEEKIARSRALAERAPSLAQRVRASSRFAHLAAWVADGFGSEHKRLHRAWQQRWKDNFEREERAGFDDFDGERRVSPQEFEEVLERWRAAVLADGARLVLISMPRRPAMELERPVLARYSERVLAFASASGTPLYDARADFADAARGAPERDRLFLPNDPVHPSPDGHAAIARALEPLVRAALDAR